MCHLRDESFPQIDTSMTKRTQLTLLVPTRVAVCVYTTRGSGTGRARAFSRAPRLKNMCQRPVLRIPVPGQGDGCAAPPDFHEFQIARWWENRTCMFYGSFFGGGVVSMVHQTKWIEEERALCFDSTGSCTDQIGAAVESLNMIS